jgi:ABC-2 type transport system permease protein
MSGHLRGRLGTIFIVIRREYLERIRTKSFIFTTLAAPVLVLGLAGISGYFAARAAIPDRHLAVVDRTEILEERLRPRLEGVGFQIESVLPGSEAEAGLEARLASGELLGALFLDSLTLAEGRATWRGRDDPPALRGLVLRQALTQSALEARLGEVDPDRTLEPLLAGGRLEVERLEEGDDDGDERVAGVAAAVVGSLFLYFVLLVYGTRVLRSVQEEKTARIVEIVISAMRPWQLMLGKILGVGAVGLSQLLIWMAAGTILGGFFLPMILRDRGMGDLPVGELTTLLPGGGVLAYFVVAFLAGYFIYASLFAAVGAICSTEEEAQQLQVPVVLLVLVPFLFLIPILDDPDSGMAVWMSLFPFFSPVLMFARVAAGEVPAWQIGLSVVLMAAALLATAWIAGRIYQTGILMQGKRPTVPEIWRWVREG